MTAKDYRIEPRPVVGEAPADAVWAYIKLLGTTAEGIARKCGISSQSVYKLVDGTRSNPKHIKDINTYLQRLESGEEFAPEPITYESHQSFGKTYYRCSTCKGDWWASEAAAKRACICES